uniref:Uncharacterized protein n=1 Tax=Cacopsylla melanoneura TaxID=428564 RepID=A0A8D9EW80_9HEMI
MLGFKFTISIFLFSGYIKDLILPTLKKLVESCFLPGQDEFLLHVCKLYSRLCNTYKGETTGSQQSGFTLDIIFTHIKVHGKYFLHGSKKSRLETTRALPCPKRV